MNQFDRYHRQMLLPGIGRGGQQHLAKARVLIVGCGALGTVIADALARAGVGQLVLVDRDIVEITNLQRQVLFDEDDVAQAMPKAEAARTRLAKINSSIHIEAHVADFNHTNADRLARGCSVLMDGLDNFHTRYLLNDLSVRYSIPYCYGGAVGTTGMAAVFHPGRGGPCLRCVFPEPPPPGSTPTCDTAGVLASAVAIIAHHQVTQAIKLIVGAEDAVDRSLFTLDIWHNQLRRLHLSDTPTPDCICCQQKVFDALDGRSGAAMQVLCGRNAVQVLPRSRSEAAGMDLDALASRLQQHGEFRVNSFILRGRLDVSAGAKGAIDLIVFPDGRALLQGISDVDIARTIYDRYIGS
ncbi:MAG: ThiF family adenylyltransferase [Phycisphaerales bacterium]